MGYIHSIPFARSAPRTNGLTSVRAKSNMPTTAARTWLASFEAHYGLHQHALPCRFEGQDVGGRVQTFSYQGHVSWHDVQCYRACASASSYIVCIALQAFEAGASIVFAKNFYVR